MQENEFTTELIAPCGADCRVCIAYFGFTINSKKRKRPCPGCRIRNNLCAFIKKQCSQLATNQIKYCFECKVFPCEKLEELDKRYRNKYGMSMIRNLNFIKDNGIDQFLKSEAERWKCPNCGGVICVHNKKCYSCP